MSIIFRYEINVPQAKNVFQSSSYEREMSDCDMFLLSDSEYEFLRHKSGIFDLFDKKFGTIIDDCEEDRIEADNIGEAIAIVEQYCNTHIDQKDNPAVSKLLEALHLAKNRNVWLFIRMCG